MTISKEFEKEVRKAASLSNALITKTPGGHLLIKLPNGKKIFTSSTPSDKRSIKNFKARLKRETNNMITEKSLCLTKAPVLPDFEDMVLVPFYARSTYRFYCNNEMDINEAMYFLEQLVEKEAGIRVEQRNSQFGNKDQKIWFCTFNTKIRDSYTVAIKYVSHLERNGFLKARIRHEEKGTNTISFEFTPTPKAISYVYNKNSTVVKEDVPTSLPKVETIELEKEKVVTLSTPISNFEIAAARINATLYFTKKREEAFNKISELEKLITECDKALGFFEVIK